MTEDWTPRINNEDAQFVIDELKPTINNHYRQLDKNKTEVSDFENLKKELEELKSQDFKNSTVFRTSEATFARKGYEGIIENISAELASFSEKVNDFETRFARITKIGELAEIVTTLRDRVDNIEKNQYTKCEHSEFMNYYSPLREEEINRRIQEIKEIVDIHRDEDRAAFTKLNDDAIAQNIAVTNSQLDEDYDEVFGVSL
jgi:Zn-dependent oligopeptidase